MKIRITESQYNRLILNEEKEIQFNFDVDTILGFAKLIGLPLKGQNEFLANKALKNKDVLSKIYSIMTSVDQKNKMIDDLDNKGMMDSNKKLHDNIEKIVNNFNKHSTESGLTKPLNLDVVLNKILRK
jgi:hypothetical protein